VVAVGMAQGPLSGLMLLDQLHLDEALADYYLFHAARADLLRRAGYVAEAQTVYARALALCQNQAERRYLSRQIAELAVDSERQGLLSSHSALPHCQRRI
jgi:RNA polymerase sigma-70 factor (ECF subfamily)